MKLNNLTSEIQYLLEQLESCYEITQSAVSIADDLLYEKFPDDKDEYNSRYYIETILFSLDDIRTYLQEKINNLKAVNFKTRVNENYQIKEEIIKLAQIIYLNREEYDDEDEDIWVEADMNIAEIFNRKPKLKLVQNNEHSPD